MVYESITVHVIDIGKSVTSIEKNDGRRICIFPKFNSLSFEKAEIQSEVSSQRYGDTFVCMFVSVTNS